MLWAGRRREGDVSNQLKWLLPGDETLQQWPGACGPGPPVLRDSGDAEQVTWLHTAQANVPRLLSPRAWAQGLCFQNSDRRTCFVPRSAGRKYKIKELCLHSKGGGRQDASSWGKAGPPLLALRDLCSVGREPRAAAASSQFAKVHPLEH